MRLVSLTALAWERKVESLLERERETLLSQEVHSYEETAQYLRHCLVALPLHQDFEEFTYRALASAQISITQTEVKPVKFTKANQPIHQLVQLFEQQLRFYT